MPKEPLSGYVFVFTGEMAMDREEAKNRSVLLGARVTTAVSSKTTHLVAGVEPGPSKMVKAQKFGTKVLNEEEFAKILEANSTNMMATIETSEKISSIETSDITNNNISNKAANNSKKTSWTEKYRPKTTDDIVGNKTAVDQLRLFLRDGTSQKAALLSGAPGIGKTTTALAVCREEGIIPIEFNASDVRSKKMLTETISKYITNLSIGNMNTGTTKKVIIMDEVDGMTSDRGGLPELVNIIKKTAIPIICICNDKTHPKMRTLANHCLDLHFRKLDARTILPRRKQILAEEGKKLPDGIYQRNNHGFKRR